MKTKKAIKRLEGVEAVLSDVIDQYAGSNGVVRKLLVTAKENIVHAIAKAAEKKATAVDTKKPGTRKNGRSSASSHLAEAATP